MVLAISQLLIRMKWIIIILLTFYSNLNSLQASGGGDGPEYSLDAMLNYDDYGTSSLYMNSPCAFEVSRRKRAAIASRCQSFHISELSILFRFSGNTDSSVILTRPSGVTIEVQAQELQFTRNVIQNQENG